MRRSSQPGHRSQVHSQKAQVETWLQVLATSVPVLRWDKRSDRHGIISSQQLVLKVSESETALLLDYAPNSVHRLHPPLLI